MGSELCTQQARELTTELEPQAQAWAGIQFWDSTNVHVGIGSVFIVSDVKALEIWAFGIENSHFVLK